MSEFTSQVENVRITFFAMQTGIYGMAHETPCICLMVDSFLACKPEYRGDGGLQRFRNFQHEMVSEPFFGYDHLTMVFIVPNWMCQEMRPLS